MEGFTNRVSFSSPALPATLSGPPGGGRLQRQEREPEAGEGGGGAARQAGPRGGGDPPQHVPVWGALLHQVALCRSLLSTPVF